MPPPCLKLVRSPRNPPKKRERTKTFTGCWTCRTRKLKCDEAQPECRQCTSKSIPCGGYGTRLHWLPCVTGHECPEPGKPKVRMEAGQRRMVVRDPLDARFTEEEIDRALQEIQQASPGKETFTKGPFHVFDGSAQISLSDTKEFSEKDQWSPLPEIDFNGLFWPEGEQTFSPQPSIFEQPVENSLSPSLANSVAISDSLSSPESSTGIPGTHESSPVGSTPVFQASNNVLELFQQPENVLQQEDPEHRNNQYILAPTPYRGLDDYPLEPRFMTSQNRLLLYHYVQNVVDLMATISTPNSPWKVIHLPASLQGSGELEATGHTPNGRNALLHAILASSACNLATQFEFSNQVELGHQYRLLGQELFCKSVALIRSCMQEELGGEKPKYKEILAAMLSMISIGVMAGETYATRLHLEGCESLIRASRERTTKSHSPKARVLHRIYYYLRIMQESTAATYELNLKLQPKQMQPALEQAGSEPQKRATSAMSLEQVTEWLSINSSLENETESFTSEFVYGVPQDLFTIVGQCTDLVQQINFFWASNPNPDSTLPQDLVLRSNEVESLILNWPITKALASPNYQRATSSTQKIIYHQTHAFHQATIIFFSQHIRPIHRYHLQPYVLNVLNHIVTIEAIKTEEGVLGGALLWPGFIAASEAIEESVQKRFLDWFDAVARVGIGSSRCAKSVLVEVWEWRRMECMEGGCKKVRTGSSWRSVAEGRGINLMLT